MIGINLSQIYVNPPIYLPLSLHIYNFNYLIMIFKFFFRYSKRTMAEISAKESPYDNMCKSLLSTSTPHRSIDDSGYCTQSSILSNAASNLSQISEVTSYFDASSDICLLQLSSNTHNFSMNHNVSKLEDVIYATNSTSNISSSFTEEELSPTKKFKLSSDMRLRYRLNNPHKDNENEFLKRKNPLPKSVNHERICLEDREKVDIMYFLAERHHFEPVTEKIFSFLSGSDIVSMSMVSKIWLNAVENSPMAQKKKRLYFKLSKENRSEYDGKNRSVFHNKGCLANIGNVMRSPSKRDLHQRSPPVSPSKYRFHVFQKVSKTRIL